MRSKQPKTTKSPEPPESAVAPKAPPDAFNYSGVQLVRVQTTIDEDTDVFNSVLTFGDGSEINVDGIVALTSPVVQHEDLYYKVSLVRQDDDSVTCHVECAQVPTATWFSLSEESIDIGIEGADEGEDDEDEGDEDEGDEEDEGE